MCNIAAEQTSTWLMVDPWEAFQSYQRTAVVLDHFDHEINDVLGGVETADGEKRRVRVMLLAGSDLISTMSEPGVWSEEDVSPSIFFIALITLTASHFFLKPTARPHPWSLRLSHNRTCGVRRRSGNRRSRQMAFKHLHHRPDDTERRLLNEDSPLPTPWTFRSIPPSRIRD